MEKITKNFQNILIFGFLSFKEKTYLEIKKKKRLLIDDSKKKNKHNIFFHFNINLLTEIIFFSIDVKIFPLCFEKNGYFFKNILKGKNIFKINNLGSGSNLELILGILCNFWVGYKKELNLPFRSKVTHLIFISKEEREQLLLVLCYITNIFYLKVIKKKASNRKMVKDNNFFVNISTGPTTMVFERKLLETSHSFLIKGDYFMPAYHSCLVKMKNFNTLINRNIQKILLFTSLVFKPILDVERSRKLNCSFNKCKNSFFSSNQIIDIANNQSGKIRRIIKIFSWLNKSKIFNSYSWGRCLLFCNLSIKFNQKSNIKIKNLLIVKVRTQIYAVLNLENHKEYYVYSNLEAKVFRKTAAVKIYDIYRENKIKMNLTQFSKILKSISFNIYFLLKVDKLWFLKLTRSCLFNRNVRDS